MTAVLLEAIPTVEADDWDTYHTPEHGRYDGVPDGYRFDTLALGARHGRDCPVPELCAGCQYLGDLYNAWRLQLSLVADGRVTEIQERVSTGKAGGSQEPQGSELAGELDHFDRLWSRAFTHRKKLLALMYLKETVYRLKYAPRRVTVGSDQWMMEAAQDGRSSRVLAEVYGVSQSTMARAIRRGKWLLASA